MKKILAITAVALMAMAGTALAAGTANLSVQATVVGSCSVTPGTLNFGSLDPFNAIDVNASSQNVQVRCAIGTTPITLTDGNGLHYAGSTKNLSNGTDTIAYSITIPAIGPGTGDFVDVSIAGTILAGAYGPTKSAGTYTDTVLLTVAP